MSRVFSRASASEATVETAVVTAAPFTFAAWIRNTGALADDDCIFNIGQASQPGNNFRLSVAGATANDPIRYLAVSGGSGGILLTTTGVTVDTWHHVACVEIASNDRAVYIDGGSKATNATSVTPPNVDRTTIGRETDSTPEDSFDGDIALPCFWDIILTDGEIAALFAGTHPARMHPGNIKGLWPLFGDASPEPDWSSGGNDLTLTSTTQGDGPPIARGVPPMEHFAGLTAAVGAIMNQIQGPNLGADLYNGALI